MKITDFDYIFVRGGGAWDGMKETYAVKGNKGYHMWGFPAVKTKKIGPFKDFPKYIIDVFFLKKTLFSIEEDVIADDKLTEFTIECELDYEKHSNIEVIDAPTIFLYKVREDNLELLWRVSDYWNSLAFAYLQYRYQRVISYKAYAQLYSLKEIFNPEVYGKNLRDLYIINGKNAPKADIIKAFEAAEKKYIMTPKELEHYNSLPDEVTIYRGTDSQETEPRTSWSLEIEVARRFAQPRLIKACVPKDRILAVFDDSVFSDFEKEVVADVKDGEYSDIS